MATYGRVGRQRCQWAGGIRAKPPPSVPSPSLLLLWAYLPDVPVDIPLAHVTEAPRLDHVAHGQVNSDQSVVGDAQDFVLFAALEPDGVFGTYEQKLPLRGPRAHPDSVAQCPQSLCEE